MRPGLIVDLFAGGGGASTGIEAATGRRVDVAVNHSPTALAVHAANHPRTVHLTSDVWEVKPREVAGRRKVDILWASPDCTHFSVAKGGKPRAQGIRSLAWVVRDWARDVRPGFIFVENVGEFRTWGPLGPDGRPDPARMGQTFEQWRGALELLGYQVDHRVLDASHFGAPTRRRRLFIVARCDGQRVAWPEPTHGPGRMPFRTAAECIDWALPCPSIFERPRPLAAATLRRIAAGVRRFVLEEPNPFVAPIRADGQHRREVVAFLAKHFGGVVGVPFDGRPLDTITAQDHHALVTVELGDAETGRAAQVHAFLTAYYGAEEDAGQDLRAPLRTVVARDRFGLVTVHGSRVITDIGMRMLEPHELLAAQFGRFAQGYDLSAATSKAARVRLIGNSVCPEVAEAVVRANLGQVAERVAA